MRVKGTLWVICMLGLFSPVGLGGSLAVTGRSATLSIPSYGKVFVQVGLILRRWGSLGKEEQFVRYGASGVPAENETLGGPHAVEQKQTNGLSG